MFRSVYSKSLFLRIIGMTLAVTQTLLLARLLGAHSLGVYSSLLAIITLLAMPVAAGVPAYLTREIAGLRARSEFEQVRPMIKAGNLIAGCVSLMSIGLLWFLYLIGVIPVPGIGGMVILSLLIPLLGLDLLRAGAMRGLDSALKSQLPENIFRPLAFALILVVVALSTELTVWLTLLSFALACGLSFILGQVMLSAMIPGLKTGTRITSLREILLGTFGLALIGGSTTLIGNLDILVLSAFGAFDIAGSYRVALQGIVALLVVHNAVGAVVLRDMAKSIGGKNIDNTIVLADRSTTLSTIGTSVVWLIMFVAGKPIIESLFGRDFSDAYIILIILGAGHLIRVASGPVFEILVMGNSIKGALIVNLLGVLVMLVLSYIFFPLSPILAVAFASSVGNAFRNLLMCRLVNRKYGFDPSLIGVMYRKLHNVR